MFCYMCYMDYDIVVMVFDKVIKQLDKVDKKYMFMKNILFYIVKLVNVMYSK